MKNDKTVMPKTGRGRLREVLLSRDLTWKILGFWIIGRLWEVVSYEGWSHTDVRLSCTKPNPSVLWVISIVRIIKFKPL